MKSARLIVSRFGNRTIECLVARLKRERRQETIASDRNSLLAEAERNKANANKYIPEMKSSG